MTILAAVQKASADVRAAYLATFSDTEKPTVKTTVVRKASSIGTFVRIVAVK